MDHDFFHLFAGFWWLIFPLFWMIAALVRMNQRHDQSNKILDLIKHYADQGKEVPLELLRALEQPDDDGLGWRGGKSRHRHGWSGVFLFAALCAGFVMFALWPGQDWGERQTAAFLFVALVMGALCLGNLVAVLLQNRHKLPPR